MTLPLILTLLAGTVMALALVFIVIRRGPGMNDEVVPDYAARARARAALRHS